MRRKSAVALLFVCFVFASSASAIPREFDRAAGLRDRVLTKIVKVIKFFVPVTNGDGLVEPRP